MKDWLEELSQQATLQKEKGRGWLDGSQPVFVYGTGSFARDVRVVLKKRGVDLLGFLDHQSTAIGAITNVPIYRPNDQKIDAHLRKSAFVIMGVHNREADVNAIIQNLKVLGYENNVVSTLDLYDEFPEDLGTRYWLASRSFVLEHKSEIAFIGNLLSDTKSRDVFEAIIQFRLTGNYAVLPTPDTDHQYYPGDLPRWPESLRFVDCGAYNGDTLDSFLGAGYKFESIAAFEPDENNFQELSNYVSKKSHKLPNASLFPCGVHSKTIKLTFKTGAGEASKVKTNGDTIIQCVSLDECIPTFQPNLIKMDIEGAEMDAIIGAQQLIKEYHPALAVSAYHTPAHIWEIPLKIHEIAKQHGLHYTYNYRAHAHNCFDTIFYAVPQTEQ